mmetsp:Transcript_16371/g.46815  ORF Transcript_16371/g.46815 Transcript_16371/m.46815 type:complete len:288 (-) Transcript_16371:30-893(-)
MSAEFQRLRCSSVVPVTFALGLFGFEWYCFNAHLAPRAFFGPNRVGGHCAAAAAIGGFNATWLLAVWSYLRSAFSDPGRVPDGWAAEVEEGYVEAEAVRAWRPFAATRCQRCQRDRPERAHHCRHCGACILRMDHHCPFIGNCVGFNNHKFFVLLCFYGSSACIGFTAVAMPYFFKLFGRRPDSLDDAPLVDPNDPGVLLLSASSAFAASLGLSLLGLFLSHVTLIARNKTTIEANYSGTSPYDLGARRNAEQLFGAWGPSWLLPVPPPRPLSDGFFYAMPPLAGEA